MQLPGCIQQRSALNIDLYKPTETGFVIYCNMLFCNDKPPKLCVVDGHWAWIVV